jgi:hypothetical protein
VVSHPNNFTGQGVCFAQVLECLPCEYQPLVHAGLRAEWHLAAQHHNQLIMVMYENGYV